MPSPMGESSGDRALDAFRRLLADAADGGQAKVDALVALSQRTVWVCTWTPGGDDYRTLVNSNGQNALPIFTDEDQLQEAATRFGWLQPDGTVPHREIGARAALRHVVAHDLGFVVVDIAADYSLEIERGEVEPLVNAKRGDSAGPNAAIGRISETMLQAVKPTPKPGSIDPVAPPPSKLPQGALDTQGTVKAPSNPPPAMPPRPGAEAKRASQRAMEAAKTPEVQEGSSPGITVSRDRPSEVGVKNATFGGGAGSVKLVPLAEPPSDELLDKLSTVLRGYPEVEWAAFCSASRGPTDPVPTVGLRVDTSYRARVNDIIGDLREAGSKVGASVDVLLLDDPKLVRSARADAIVFFPWRRRTN